MIFRLLPALLLFLPACSEKAGPSAEQVLKDRAMTASIEETCQLTQQVADAYRKDNDYQRAAEFDDAAKGPCNKAAEEKKALQDANTALKNLNEAERAFFRGQ